MRNVRGPAGLTGPGDWWRALAELVLPGECAGCGAPRSTLCERCRRALARGSPRPVRPRGAPGGLPPVWAAVPYADAVRSVLLAHKERGALPLAAPLGEALAVAVRAALREGRVPPDGPDPPDGQAAGDGPVVLVPVPSARRAVRVRGHDPARRIALAAAGVLRRSGTPARTAAVLRQRRAVADQAGLDAAGRLANLDGALELRPGGEALLAAAGRLLVVDDVTTTGASVAEAARVLRSTAERKGTCVPFAAAVVAASPLFFD
ncbi:ComF family protein [Streptomyces fragilis]|uniref:ComF family protein n=2 Tax=Streptomyces fragilis TaxID=67301 RepID=A0ABV2YDW8_9ACTN|nr:ComF family protein [Streptomyces fragilis]